MLSNFLFCGFIFLCNVFFTFSLLSSFLFSFLHSFFLTFFFYALLFCSTFSQNIFCCSTEVSTGLMLWDFFLGVARKIKQSINKGGTIPFLINGFKCRKSEDIEAATAGLDIYPVGKLG